MQNNLFEEPLPAGVTLFRNFLTLEEQRKVAKKCAEVFSAAPLLQPKTKSGFNFAVQITSVGDYGWFSSPQSGYEYLRRHPETKLPFPPIPRSFRQLVNRAAEQIGWIFKPDTCLINYYPAGTGRLGLHRDDTEEDQKSPIISLSIGQSCSFLVGGHLRHDETQSMVIHSGDCLIFHREGRLLYHGVDKLFAGSDTDSILPAGGRISLTFRRHKIPAREKKYNSRFLQGI